LGRSAGHAQQQNGHQSARNISKSVDHRLPPDGNSLTRPLTVDGVHNKANVRFRRLCDDKVVGRIMKAAAAPVGTPWLWTFAYGAHRDYSTTYGYAVDRDEAMKAFAKAWRGG
jgi:hypothetical protein